MSALVVVDTHQSGHHAATDDQWGRALAQHAGNGSTVVGFTECRVRRAVLVDKVDTEWGSYAPAAPGMPGPNAAECAAAWDTSVWAKRAAGWEWLTRDEFRTGTGAVRPGVVMTWVLLERRATGATLLRPVWHMPSSVQAGDAFADKAARNTAWRSAKVGARREINQLVHSLAPTNVLASADFNVDLAREAWAERVERPLDNIADGLKLHVPDGGTHGRRRIDAHGSDLRLRGPAQVQRPLAGFDHRAVRVRLVGRLPFVVAAERVIFPNRT